MNEPSVTSVDGQAPSASAQKVQQAQQAQRERIRLAAVQLFTRQGFAGTSMKQLAGALKMATANLYNYYPTKEAILFEVLEHQLLAVIDRNRTIMAKKTEPEETLASLVYDLVVNDLNDPLAAFVGIQGVQGLSGDNLAYISELMSQIRSIWISVIARGKAKGVFRMQDPKLCALSILSLCSSVSTWYRPDGGYTPEYVADGVSEMALRMAGAA